MQRYKFNPVLGKLKHLASGDLIVSFSKEVNRPDFSYGIPATFAATVADITDNYREVAGAYAALRTVQKSTYLIITTSSLQSSLSSLSKFKNIKANQGFNVETITESTWGGGGGWRR